MKKRQFSKKINLTKVTVTDLNLMNGGRAAGTHYEWCKADYTEFPCTIGDQ